MLNEMIGHRVGSKWKHYRKYFCFSTVTKPLKLRLTNRIGKFAIKVIMARQCLKMLTLSSSFRRRPHARYFNKYLPFEGFLTWFG